MLSKVYDKVAREGLFAAIRAVLMYPFNMRVRREYRQMLRHASVEERFDTIYEKQLWGSRESGSGEGSELEYSLNLRSWLIKSIPTLGVKVFVDAPCGDFNWMRYVVSEMDFDYFGLDIVESVIKKNQRNYSSERVCFKVADICEELLPACDLLMVRDCLFHLSFEDIDRFLKNLAKTDYKYLLTTTHVVNHRHKNRDILTGDFRVIDLFSAPFCFQRGSCKELIRDCPKGAAIEKELVLVEKCFVPQSLSS